MLNPTVDPKESPANSNDDQQQALSASDLQKMFLETLSEEGKLEKNSLHVDATLMAIANIHQKTTLETGDKLQHELISRVSNKLGKNDSFEGALKELGEVSHTAMATMHPDFPVTREYISASKKLADAIKSGDEESITEAMSALHKAQICDFKTVSMSEQADKLAVYDSWYAEGRKVFLEGLYRELEKKYGAMDLGRVQQFQQLAQGMLKTGNWLADKDGKPASTAEANRESYHIYRKGVIQNQADSLEKLIGKMGESEQVQPLVQGLDLLRDQLLHMQKTDFAVGHKEGKSTLQMQWDQLSAIKEVQEAFITNNFDALQKSGHLQEVAILFSGIRTSLDFEFRPRQEAVMHSAALNEFFATVWNKIPEEYRAKKDGYEALDPSEKDALIQYVLSEDGERIREQLQGKFSDSKFLDSHANAKREADNFGFYKEFGTKTLQLAQYEGAHNYSEVFLLRTLSGVSEEKLFDMEVSVLPEDPAKYNEMIKNPEGFFADLFKNPLMKQYFLKHKRFSMLFPSSDSARLGHITATISREQLRDKLKELFESKGLSFCFNDGGGLQNARGGIPVLLSGSSDATHQNGMLFQLGLNPEYLGSTLGVILLKQYDRLESAKEKNPEYEELLRKFANAGMQKKTELRESSAFNAYITKSGLSQILDIFKLHRAERDSGQGQGTQTKLEKADAITAQDVKTAKPFTEFRSITDDFAQFMLDSNKWFGLLEAMDESGIKGDLIKKLADYSPAFRVTLEKMATTLYNSNPDDHWLLVGDEVPSDDDLTRWAEEAKKAGLYKDSFEFEGEDIMQSDQVRNMMAYLTLQHRDAKKRIGAIIEAAGIDIKEPTEEESQKAKLAREYLATTARTFRENVLAGKDKPLSSIADDVGTQLAAARSTVWSSQHALDPRYLEEAVESFVGKEKETSQESTVSWRVKSMRNQFGGSKRQ